MAQSKPYNLNVLDGASDNSEEDLEELLRLKKKIENKIKSIKRYVWLFRELIHSNYTFSTSSHKRKRSHSKHKVDFDDNINDRDEDFEMPRGPTKSQISREIEDRGIPSR